MHCKGQVLGTAEPDHWQIYSRGGSRKMGSSARPHPLYQPCPLINWGIFRTRMHNMTLTEGCVKLSVLLTVWSLLVAALLEPCCSVVGALS